MLLRQSMRVVLNPESSVRELAAALIEWFMFGLVLCLGIGLIDGGSRAVALIAGVLTGLTGVGGLLLVRRVTTGRVWGKE